MLDKLPVRIYSTADNTGEERQEKNVNDGLDNIVNKNDELKDGEEKGFATRWAAGWRKFWADGYAKGWASGYAKD